MCTNNCQDNNNVSMSSISWEALLLLPAFRYMKPPVDNVPQLYERYINGNEKGSFAFVYEENTFYTFHPRGLNPGEWKPIDGGLSSFFEIDQTLLLEGDILVYNASKQKFVVKSGNVWNKIKSAFTQVNRFLNHVEDLPIETDSPGVYFVNNNTLSALYLVLSNKVVKIYNSEDHYFRNIIDALLNVIRGDITFLKTTKVDRSELANISVGIKDYKPSVTNISDLPISNNTSGDARVVKNDLNESGQPFIWLWNGTAWSRTAFTTFPSNVAPLIRSTDNFKVAYTIDGRVFNDGVLYYTGRVLFDFESKSVSIQSGYLSLGTTILTSIDDHEISWESVNIQYMYYSVSDNKFYIQEFSLPKVNVMDIMIGIVDQNGVITNLRGRNIDLGKHEPIYIDGYITSNTAKVYVDFNSNDGFTLRNTGGSVLNNQGSDYVPLLEGEIISTGPANTTYVYFNAYTHRLEIFSYSEKPSRTFKSMWFIGTINPILKKATLQANQLFINNDLIVDFKSSQKDDIAKISTPVTITLPAKNWLSGKIFNSELGIDGIFGDKRCLITEQQPLINIRLNLKTAGIVRIHLLNRQFQSLYYKDFDLSEGISSAMISGLTYSTALYVGIQNITGIVKTVVPADNIGNGFKVLLTDNSVQTINYSIGFELIVNDVSTTLIDRTTALEGIPGTNSTDLQTIINRSNGNITLGVGEFNINATIDIPSGTKITGIRGKTIIKVANGVQVGLRIKNVTDVKLLDLTIVGQYPDIPLKGGLQPVAPGVIDSWQDAINEIGKGIVGGVYKPQIGVQIDTSEKIEMYGCEIKNFSCYGLNIIKAGKNYRYAIRIMNNWINNCYCGMKTEQEAERSNFIANTYTLCQIGVYLDSGTNMFSACPMTANRVGMVVGSGINHAHGAITDSPFTHCSLHGIIAVDISYGQVFNGCKIGYTDGQPALFVKNSRGIFFNNGVIVQGLLKFEDIWMENGHAAGVNTCRGNQIIGWGAFEYDPITSPLILRDNIILDGTSNTNYNNNQQ